MRALLFALLAALLLATASAYQVERTRDDLVARYYSQVDSKIPKSVRMIIGDERVNAYIGHSVIGIETKRGELYSLEYEPLKNPSIVIVVTDDAAERIENRTEGILAAIDNGGIRIKTNGWLPSFKMEALKQAYAISGIDRRLTNKSVQEGDIYSANSLFMNRPRAWAWN
jgi:hypothetical protein